ncbi:spore coat protein [Bacillus stratosphericus LAMA 585]|nr:spore coat protein [Bacillus stratosphericus LAMA 585]
MLKELKSMSCGKHHGRHDENCVCDAVDKILAEQEAVEDKCPTSCYSNLLSPTVSGKDTIPFLLFDKKGGLFSTFGNIGGFVDDCQCFESIFFRVEKLHDCCATLSVLRPVDVHGHTLSVCHPCDPDFFGLEKADFCIEVDLNCFCAIQCLNPELVDRVMPTKDKKHHHHG